MFIRDHFTDLLVTALIVFFTFITLHVLHLKTAGDDGFKWAAGIVGNARGRAADADESGEFRQQTIGNRPQKKQGMGNREQNRNCFQPRLHAKKP